MPIRDNIADAFADTDELVLSLEEEVKTRTLELMFEPGERDSIIFLQALDTVTDDSDIWLGVSPEDMNEIDTNERDLEWMGVQAALAAAAVQQARLELIYRPLLEAAENGSQSIVAANSRLSNEQRRVAATEGVGKARFEAAREARRGRA